MMNPFEQMELKKKSLTKKEMEVYHIFTENIDDIIRNTATCMAEKYQVSQPAITRFCQKLGYQGYNDFKYDVYKYYKAGKGAKNTSSVVDYYTRLIHLIPGAVGVETFEGLARLIADARYISICGNHKSSLPAQLLDMNLAKLGILSSFVRADYFEFLAQRASSKDVVIIFSATGSFRREHIDLVNELPADKRPVSVLVTQTDKHPIRNKVDHVVWLPSYENQGYPQYLEVQVAPVIFVDLLTNYIVEYVKEEGISD
ncbi:MAG: MurR/RpiR family transcriptional regulator [Hungatella sp.]|nr:MurR/RpiR family transcriptional regulator [Hungatella sp.]